MVCYFDFFWLVVVWVFLVCGFFFFFFKPKKSIRVFWIGQLGAEN